MCLHPQSVDLVPEETAHVAKAAFPKGTVCMTMRNELGAILEDEDLAHLFLRRGQPAMAPWRLALVAITQFAEGLSDRQAADAVRGRIDCKNIRPTRNVCNSWLSHRWRDSPAKPSF